MYLYVCVCVCVCAYRLLNTYIIERQKKDYMRNPRQNENTVCCDELIKFGLLACLSQSRNYNCFYLLESQRKQEACVGFMFSFILEIAAGMNQILVV